MCTVLGLACNCSCSVWFFFLTCIVLVQMLFSCFSIKHTKLRCILRGSCFNKYFAIIIIIGKNSRTPTLLGCFFFFLFFSFSLRMHLVFYFRNKISWAEVSKVSGLKPLNKSIAYERNWHASLCNQNLPSLDRVTDRLRREE